MSLLAVMVRWRVVMDDLAAENHALREQLAATGEILRVINQSTSDVEPVLEAIVDGAMRLCEGVLGAVYQWDGERVTLLASRNYPRRRAARCSADTSGG